MELLSTIFADQRIIWLLITTIVAFISGFISSYLTYYFIRRQEIKDIIIADIQKQRDLETIESYKAKNERIRQEITRWTNPILGAVQDLEARLTNILEIQGYTALTENYQENVNPNWSISYEYFMNSSLYLFAQYFCWIRILQKRINFEMFKSQQEKNNFFKAIECVCKALGDFPPNYGRGDMQLFQLQQRAIGEQMIVRNGDDLECLSYSEFIKKLIEDNNFERQIMPLRSLLDDLDPENVGRWERFKTTQKQLKILNDACIKILSNTQ
jgi:hypothetical protein